MMSGTKRPGVLVYFEIRPSLKRLTSAQKGDLLDAIMAYGEDGIEPEFNDVALEIVWDFVKPKLDGDAGRYEETCNKRKSAANKRWNSGSDDANACTSMQMDANACTSMQTMPTTTTTATTTESINKTPSNEGEGAKAPSAPARMRFTPPTVNEVAAYAKDKGLELDADRFCDFYAAKGWQVGKNPMKDWQAAVRNWARGETSRGSPQPKQPKVVRDQQYEQRPYENSPDIPDWMMARWQEMQKDQPKPARQPKMVREQLYDQRPYTNGPDIPDWMEDLRKELYDKEQSKCAT